MYLPLMLLLVSLLNPVLSSVPTYPKLTKAEQLHQYAQKPLPLTKKSLYQLATLELLTQQQLDSFCRFVDKHGRIRRLHDLGRLPHWEQKHIEAIRPYISPKGKGQRRKLPKQKAHTSKAPKRQRKKEEILPRKTSGKKAQISPNTWGFLWVPSVGRKKDEGGPYRLSSWFIHKEKGLYELALLHYKGVGEPYRYGYSRGYSMLEKGIIPYIHRLIVGQYSVHLAQGLIIGDGMSFGTDAQKYLSKTKHLVKPCAKNSRNQGLAGAAIHLKGLFDIAIYTAYNQYCATCWRIKDDKKAGISATIEDMYVRSIPQSNTTYRNEQQYATKRYLTEKLLGSTVMYAPSAHSRFGAQYLVHKYNIPIQQQNQCVSSYQKLGCWTELNYAYLKFKGEIAMSLDKSMALILAHKIPLSKKSHISLVLQHYSPNFCSLHGNAKQNQQSILLAGYKKIGKTSINGSLLINQAVDSALQHQASQSKKVGTLAIDHTFDKQLSIGTHGKIHCIDDHEKKVVGSWKAYLSYLWGSFTIKGTLATAFDRVKHFSLALALNITYTIKHLKITLFVLMFNGAKQPLYLYRPSIEKGPPPKLLGKGASAGMTVTYQIKNKLNVSFEGRTDCKKQINGTYGCTPRFTCKLCFNG